MKIRQILAGAALGLAHVLTAPVYAADTEITLWSHYAAEIPKRSFIEQTIAEFEAANPGVKVNATFYEKTALFAALKTALRAGQGPDVFYAEPSQTEYIDAGFLLDLADLNWDQVKPWAQEAWTHDGVSFGLPIEAWTIELFYNKDMMSDLGISLPENLQLSSEDFEKAVGAAIEAGIVPMSLGVGDRPFTGAPLIHEALLKKLGVEEYTKLIEGNLDWKDPRVLDTLNWITGLTSNGLLPKTFATLKLAEAHTYFHTKPGTLMFLNGSWYTSRAFNTPEKGGQPADFPLGIMQFPEVPGAVCNECRSIAVGGSYVANADTEHPEVVIDFMNAFLTPDSGNRWLDQVMVQTGIKADPSTIKNPRAADYFSMIDKTNEGNKYFFGIPLFNLSGKPKEVFTQVFNNALPAGNITVEEAVKLMNAAY
jgi:multiple sugar transport system substrate-binding protein